MHGQAGRAADRQASENLIKSDLIHPGVRWLLQVGG